MIFNDKILAELSTKNYVRKALAKNNFWVDFSKQKMNSFIERFGEHFNVIIFSEKNIDTDYYIIPYSIIKSSLDNSSLTEGAHTAEKERWIATITNHKFKVSKKTEIDVVEYYHNDNPNTYLLTKGQSLPTSSELMQTSSWFHLWQNRFFPYSDLKAGDIIFWYDPELKALVWKTKVIEVERYQYEDKHALFEEYKNSMEKKYFENRPTSGYFLKYQIKVLESISIPKPENYRFSRQGWQLLNDQLYTKWFRQEEPLSINPGWDQLVQLNEKMQNQTLERIVKKVDRIIRNDYPIVQALKRAVEYKCQFPGCNHQIKKANGEFYIEVAHIKPFAGGGQSVWGNLLVLCPNHHKEFDLGQINITYQSLNKLTGELNGTPFDIDLFSM